MWRSRHLPIAAFRDFFMGLQICRCFGYILDEQYTEHPIYMHLCMSADLVGQKLAQLYKCQPTIFMFIWRAQKQSISIYLKLDCVRALSLLLQSNLLTINMSLLVGQYIPEENSFEMDLSFPPRRKVEDQTLPYYGVEYVQGTLCDINMRPRRTTVIYVCIPEARNQVIINKM